MSGDAAYLPGGKPLTDSERASGAPVTSVAPAVHDGVGLVRSVVIAVPDGSDGRRLDVIVASAFPEFSRSRIARWIADGRILLDGRPRRAGHRCRGGQEIRAEIPEDGGADGASAAPLPGDQAPLDVLYEDEAIAVLDKPAGLVVHPGPGHPGGTLANRLVAAWPEIAAVGPAERPGLVHRLDRGTSGVMVVARTEPARLRLAESFARREVGKRYLALVLGRFPDALRMTDPIGRDPAAPQRFRARGRRARDAESEAELREELPLSSLLRVRLLTGRTHQARVHLAAAGFPIVGDALYGPGAPRRGGGAAGGVLRRVERPALHAELLAFNHPLTGARMRFRAPLPQDLTAVLDRLRHLRDGSAPL